MQITHQESERRDVPIAPMVSMNPVTLQPDLEEVKRENSELDYFEVTAALNESQTEQL